MVVVPRDTFTPAAMPGRGRLRPSRLPTGLALHARGSPRPARPWTPRPGRRSIELGLHAYMAIAEVVGLVSAGSPDKEGRQVEAERPTFH